MAKSLYQKGKTSALKYSAQAQLMLANLADDSIDFEKFEEWFKENKLVVGGGDIIEFLEKKNEKAHTLVDQQIKHITGLPDV